MKTNPGPGYSKQGQDNPGVSAKFKYRYESLKTKFSFLFACNAMI